VARKASGMLPVYRKFKNGRTRTITIIRRVDGNANEFVKLLSKSIPENRIKVKLGNVVHLEGNYVDLVREWLTLHKF
jgi:large subunit ribosomal protein L49